MNFDLTLNDSASVKVLGSLFQQHFHNIPDAFGFLSLYSNRLNIGIATTRSFALSPFVFFFFSLMQPVNCAKVLNIACLLLPSGIAAAFAVAVKFL